MKTIFIAYNQAFNMEIVDILEELDCKGYTMWNEVTGRGSVSGEPHLGTHAWPTLNNAMLVVVEDYKVDAIFEKLYEKDHEYEELGLRAFVWHVERTY